MKKNKTENEEKEVEISPEEAELYNQKLSQMDEDFKKSLEASNVQLEEEEVDENGKPKIPVSFYLLIGFMVLIFVVIIVLTIVILNMPSNTNLNLL